MDANGTQRHERIDAFPVPPSPHAAKANALHKECLAHATAVTQRNALRNDVNRLTVTYKAKQQMIEQQIVEIEKLNSVINRCVAQGGV